MPWAYRRTSRHFWPCAAWSSLTLCNRWTWVAVKVWAISLQTSDGRQKISLTFRIYAVAGWHSLCLMASKFLLRMMVTKQRKPRTPDERPGRGEQGLFFWDQGGRDGPLCFFLSMYSPRAHPGPPSPMDSEILIKPLSLWPEYSMGGRLILLKTGSKNEP